MELVEESINTNIMKKIIFPIILTISTLCLSSITVSAQSLSNNMTGNSYLAINTIKSEKNLKYSPEIQHVLQSSTELSKYALYMISEQFVFDNLKSLKSTYSAADIYFDLDESAIRQDAVPALQELIQLLNDNPGLAVAITSHADSRMGKYNEKLSLARANASKAYLVNNGIDAVRIQIDKFGRPSTGNPCNDDPSCSLEVQQLNRKTEFNIIYNGINLGQVL